MFTMNSKISVIQCCPDMEALTTMCRPLYLPTDLSMIVITTVYNPLDASISSALAYLYDVNSSKPTLRADTSSLRILINPTPESV